ncbi:multicopper oxidase [Myriangium duriaei CBS 260.36]|uniref:Multicopper oxidase n=1 Tax=Myriangium duriaei CBS 260.36 TaxID=1168546 RepID=A0A9P4ME86_9PEZI|nr:multicopper oxidase [Myriangium duriaei CBS 260.36]
MLRLIIILCSVAYVAWTAEVRTNLTLTWEPGNPNGNQRELIKINGEMPGPELRFDEGDQVEVLVQNDMPFNTTVHWHGLLMRDSPWSDGVPGLTQKPIEPGQSFIYRFTAEPAGTYWYHSHSRMTLLDGLYGPLHIRPNPGSPTPYSLISSNHEDLEQLNRAAREPVLVTLSDWTNWTSWDYMDIFETSNAATFCSDSILVNGHGSTYCPGQEFLINNTRDDMTYFLAPAHVTDKGCLPFVFPTEGYFLDYINTSALPEHYYSGCIGSSSPNATIEVDPSDGWVSLNWIMAALNKMMVVSVDEHDMWVYEADGQFIAPQKVQALTMYPGQRYAALIKLNKERKDYTIRVPDNGLAQVQAGYAVLSYKGGSGWAGDTKPWITWNGNYSSPETVFLNDTIMPTFPVIAPARYSDQTIVVRMSRSGQPYLWSMSKDGTALYPQDDFAYTPLLFNTTGALGNGINENLVIRTENNTYVDIILQVGWRKDELQEITHILHKHASKMWIIGSGTGVWNYTDTNQALDLIPENFNLESPSYRDTFTTSFAGPSWVALRYHVNVPGAWFFHCHVEIHLGGGMAMAILDGVDVWPTVPPELVFRH